MQRAINVDPKKELRKKLRDVWVNRHPDMIKAEAALQEAVSASPIDIQWSPDPVYFCEEWGRAEEERSSQVRELERVRNQTRQALTEEYNQRLGLEA